MQPCALQRVTRSCTASPISRTLTMRRDGRNGTSWTSRLITAEWDSRTPSGNSPPSTNATRSVSRHLWPVVPFYPNKDMAVNLDFLFMLCPKVSDTYPADLFVPESASPPVIVGSSKFRSRGRFPTLSYYSKENHVSWLRTCMKGENISHSNTDDLWDPAQESLIERWQKNKDKRS